MEFRNVVFLGGKKIRVPRSKARTKKQTIRPPFGTRPEWNPGHPKFYGALGIVCSSSKPCGLTASRLHQTVESFGETWSGTHSYRTQISFQKLLRNVKQPKRALFKHSYLVTATSLLPFDFHLLIIFLNRFYVLSPHRLLLMVWFWGLIPTWRTAGMFWMEFLFSFLGLMSLSFTTLPRHQKFLELLRFSAR